MQLVQLTFFSLIVVLAQILLSMRTPDAQPEISNGIKRKKELCHDTVSQTKILFMDEHVMLQLITTPLPHTPLLWSMPINIAIS